MVLLAAIGCGGRLMPVASVTGLPASSPVALRAAILSALDRLEYRVEGQSESAVTARWVSGAKQFRIHVAYDQRGYQIDLLDSAGLDQRINPNTGQVMINSRYHQQVRKLDTFIRRHIEDASTTAGGSGGGPVERSLPVEGPVDYAVIQRGVLLAGLRVASENPDAGVLSTELADTGFKYGFIDDEPATVHLSYTVAISPGAIRVLQQVQKCVSEYVLEGSVATRHPRCVPMGGPVGPASDQMHALLTSIQRELQNQAAQPPPPELTMEPAVL
jgi:hypothetical protein